jgi:transglutaminase-like putative cysteine protease
MSAMNASNKLATPLFQLVLIGTIAVLIAGAVFLRAWVLIAFAILAVFLMRQMGKKRIRLPEGSRRLRVIAFTAQAVGALSLASVTGLWGLWVITVVILGMGHYAAYRYREKPPLIMRVGAFLALHLAFLWMFVGLFNGQPYPQAQVAMLAMAAVSFELFSRLNLYSGIGIGLIDLYVAATLSRDISFLIFLFAYLALLLAFMWRADDEDGLRDNPVVLRPSGATSPARARLWIGRFALLLPLMGMVVFIFTPRFASYPIVPPFTITAPVRGGSSAAIINPAIPLVQVQGWSNQVGEYYYGFDSQLDLGYRGGLSNDIMMYVRSPAASYWRSHGYDYYSGRTWKQSDTSTELIGRKGRAFTLSDESWLRRDYFVQTYTIVRPLPNLVFTAGKPLQVYMDADRLALDTTGGLRVGDSLQPGLVYSVLSLRQDVPADALRGAGDIYPNDIRSKYLQLPDTVTQRTRDLAAEVTRNARTPYDKVVALREYLKANYPYDYFPPPQPPNTDSVDQFLFVDKRGVCEHYVSALVVMLRTLGIPARLVSGFGTGTFNPFTNYYEVHANDAHAWAEVYFPNYGWIPFDPTPGWNGDPQTGPVQRWAFSGLFENVELPSIPLGDIARGGMSLLSTLIGPLLMVGSIALAGWLAWRWRGRIRFTFQRLIQRDPARARVLAAYQRAQRRLKNFRGGGQTAQEHAAANPQFRVLADWVDIAAYAPEPPDADTVKKAESWRPPET